MIPPDDLLVESYDPRPPGGQKVGVHTGVRVTHRPTGLVAICETERSQHRNRLIAVAMIEGGLTCPEFRG